MRKRGENSGAHVVAYVLDSVTDDLDALDMLGRSARQAIYDAPMKISALAILNELTAAGYDPQHPDIDRFVARGIMMNSFNILRRDRTTDQAHMGIMPLRGKISVKSTREQRRTMRRVRW